MTCRHEPFLFIRDLIGRWLWNRISVTMHLAMGGESWSFAVPMILSIDIRTLSIS
jgi:hypothetical protein